MHMSVCACARACVRVRGHSRFSRAASPLPISLLLFPQHSAENVAWPGCDCVERPVPAARDALAAAAAAAFRGAFPGRRGFVVSFADLPRVIESLPGPVDRACSRQRHCVSGSRRVCTSPRACVATLDAVHGRPRNSRRSNAVDRKVDLGNCRRLGGFCFSPDPWFVLVRVYVCVYACMCVSAAVTDAPTAHAALLMLSQRNVVAQRDSVRASSAAAIDADNWGATVPTGRDRLCSRSRQAFADRLILPDALGRFRHRGDRSPPCASAFSRIVATTRSCCRRHAPPTCRSRPRRLHAGRDGPQRRGGRTKDVV